MWQVLAQILMVVFSDGIKGIVSRILLAIGLGTITAVGMNALISGALNQAQVALQSNSQVGAAMSAMGVTWFMSLIISGISTRIAISALSSDAVSFWVMRRGLPSS